jgi:hypothetical protein
MKKHHLKKLQTKLFTVMTAVILMKTDISIPTGKGKAIPVL